MILGGVVLDPVAVAVAVVGMGMKLRPREPSAVPPLLRWGW